MLAEWQAANLALAAGSLRAEATRRGAVHKMIGILPDKAQGLYQIASSKLVKSSTLKAYKGAQLGLTDMHKEELNADLLAFLKA